MATPEAKAPSSGSQPALQSERKAPRMAALALVAAASAIALVALIGWASGHLIWAGAVATYHPIAPVTAIGVLLLGLALALHIQHPEASRVSRLAATLTALVGLYAIGVLLQTATGLGAGLDRLFAPRATAAQDADLGRIAPMAAALFLSLAAAFLLDLAGRTRRVLRDAATVLAGVTLAGAVAIGIGYLFGVPFFYAGGQVPPAFPAALSFALLALALLATRDRRTWGGTHRATTIVVSVGVAASVASSAVVASLERERAHVSFVRRASTLGTALERSVVENFDEVERLTVFLAAGQDIQPQEFHWAVAGRLASHPAILALGWAPRVPAGQASARDQGGRRAADETMRYPLRYVEGREAARALAGLDLATVPAVREAIEAAARSGDLAASAEVTLGAPGLAEPAIWVVIPVVRPSATDLEDLRGFAIGLFPLQRMAARALIGLNRQDTAVTLGLDDGNVHPSLAASGTEATAVAANWEHTFTVAGRRFRIQVTPPPGLDSSQIGWLPTGMLGCGLLITVLLGVYLTSLASHAAETQRLLVAVRDGEKRANESLSLLDQTVAAMPVPVFLKGRDGAYQMCNAEMGRWLGRDAAELIGRHPEEVYPEDHAGELQTMDEALLAQPGSQTLETSLAGADGGARDVVVHKASVLGPRGAVRGVVGVMFDVTEQRRAEALQAALLELSEATYAATGIDELLPTVHRVVGRLMVARNLYVALLDPASGLLTFPYFVDEEDELAPEPRPPGRGLTEYVLRTGKPALVPPQRFDELVEAGEVEPMGAPSIDWLGVPLVIGGVPRGVLAVQTYTEGERYGDRDRDLLTVVARSIAEGIERTQTAVALRESEERFRAFADSANDTILTVGADGVILYANRAALTAFGYPEGMTGRRLETIIPAVSLPRHQVAFADAARSGRSAPTGTVFELSALRRDGSEFPVELSLASWLTQGNVYVSAIVRDVSERKRLDQQLVRAQRMEAMGRLAGGVAHDLNNAMQSMLTSTALARARTGDPAALDASLATLDEEIRRATGTTRQLLLFSRREVTKFEPLDLAELVRGSESLLRSLLRGDALLRVDVQAATLPIYGDRGQLEQALMNLVANASDAMPDGGTVTVTAGPEHVGAVFVEVADTGIGMSDEVRAHLFEPFFTTKSAEHGTGLGLSVTQGIVTSHGGCLEVESGVGRGSRFRVVLPRHAHGPIATPPPVDHLGRGRRILLVEDEDGAREGLTAVLGLMGFAVTAVGSGEAALELPPDAAFDLLLTDIVLPGVGGGEVARRLSARWPRLKVVLMSGHAEDVLARQQVRVGEALFLQKPFGMDALARELAAALAAG